MNEIYVGGISGMISTDLLTKTTEPRPCRKDDGFSASQKLPAFYNPAVQLYCLEETTTGRLP